ncbi:MAG: Psr/DMSO reductase-like protein chain [Firmicutes bacterium]|nr:Psr/DMSO reductase-like protein chain [Bacillota bacterium]
MSIQWPLVFFTLFVGLGCGIFVGSVVLTEWCGKAKQIRTISSSIAIVALGVGGVSSTMHLGHPERMFGALGHPTSGIFMESTMIGLFGLAIIVYLLALRRNASDRTCKVIATIGAVLAVVLAFVNGHAYVIAARPAWNTLILPLLYVASAGVMGCFSLSVLLARTKYADTIATIAVTETAATAETSTTTATTTIKRATLIALAFQAVLLIAYLIHVAVAPYPDITRSVMRVLTGNLALLFWGGVVLLGFLVPTVLMTKFYTKNTESISPLTSVKLSLASVLVAGVAFRALMFLIGSSIKQFF